MTSTRAQDCLYDHGTVKSNEIRLLRLGPGEKSEPLVLSLQCVDVTTLPEYTALSYCWGTGESKECYCRGESSNGTLYITDDLAQALVTLRSSTGQTVLWVDQICINQKNSEERATQVKMMSTIYTKAEQVVIWLGNPGEDTEMVFKLINSTADHVRQQMQKFGPERAAYNPENPRSVHYPLDLTPATTPEWVAFRKLFQRSWFSRVWTFQEAVLAKRAVLRSGDHSASLSAFSTVVMSVNAYDRQGADNESHLKGEDEICNALLYCNALKTTFAARPNIQLFAGHTLAFDNLVRDMMRRNTSEAHDKIYGVLGIVIDVDPAEIPIQYSKPFWFTYTYFTKFFIRQHNDLSILALARMLPSERPLLRPYNGPLCLPSWVPDYRFEDSATTNPRLNVGSKVIQHGINRYYSASGLSKAFVELDDSPNLRVNGVKIGALQQRSAESGNDQGQISLGENVLTGGQWSQMAESIARDGKYNITGEPISLAYARLRLWDQLPGELQPVNRRLRQRQRQRPLQLDEPKPSSFIKSPEGGRLLFVPSGDKMPGCILYRTMKQRLFITDNGYMGLAHQTCLIGDEVWLLLGAETPVILRPLAHGSYEFRGEAYVHGIMDGEYLTQNFKAHDLARTHLDDQAWLSALAEGIPFATTEVVLS